MADIYDDYADILSQTSPTGDKDAQTWSEIDPLGDAIFGWGDASRNRQIRRRQAAIAEMQGRITAEQRRRLEQSVAANSADWDKLTTDILGADGNKLKDFYSGLESQEAGYYDQLKQAMGDYNSVEDLFSNPNFYGDVGDVQNAVKPSDTTVQAQRQALAQMQAQSSPQETAAERFQRLTAQREAEANMKGARDSIAQDLKARGVYGSGAEIVQNMMAQADAANRRYMANLAADAQAQERATKMLGSSADLASKMRTSEMQEGALANQVSMFNNQVNQNLMNLRSGQNLNARMEDNREGAKRGNTLYQAGMGQTGNQRSDMASQINTQSGLTKGKIGVRDAGRSALDASDENFLAAGDKQKAALESDIETPWLGGGIG